VTAPQGQPGARPGHRVLLTSAEADIGVLSAVIADAFDDLAVSRWLITDPDDRRARYPDYFRLYVQSAMEHGVVYTTPEHDAVALWFEGTGPAVPPDSYPRQLAAVTGPWVDRFQSFDHELDVHHPAGILHHHLAVLAVRPGRQGLGIGTALLDAHHRRLDLARIPAYLEASDQDTRRIYLAHGYTDHGRSPIRLPAGPVMHPMWRAPRQPAVPGRGLERG
jgi:GNAT superfamily N-acetyltransferase